MGSPLTEAETTSLRSVTLNMLQPENQADANAPVAGIHLRGEFLQALTQTWKDTNNKIINYQCRKYQEAETVLNNKGNEQNT